MVLQKLSQTLRIMLALILAVFSTGALPTTVAYAKDNTPPVRNAGTIKIADEVGLDDIPQNDPMLTDCDVVVEFYNFDNTANENATVDFQLQEPTAGVGYSRTVSGNATPTVLGDGDGDGEGSQDADGSYVYTLSFTGTPKETGNTTGYKVKVDVDIENTNGGAKQKVFWMPASCATTSTTVSPEAPLKDDQCGTENDEIIKPQDSDQVSYSLNGNVVTATLKNPATHDFGEPLNGYVVANDGLTASYTVSAFTNEPCLVPVVCETPENGGVITQNTQGWTVKNAEFVDDGLKMSSDNWSGSYIVNESEYEISEAPKLDWEIEGSVSGAHGIAIIFRTEGGANIHYEPVPYSDDFWTNTPGILPENAGGQGGKYSGSLQDLLDHGGDHTIVKTYFYFTSATANEIVLKSLSFNCTQYTFDKAPRVPTVCTLPDNEFIQPWEYDEVTYPEAEDYEGTGGMVANNATYEFTNEGLHLSTPDVDSSVYGLIDAGSTPLQDVDKMSYDTFRKTESAGYQNTLPAYILVVDTNGPEVADGMKYFFYEPYNNMPPAVAENTWQTWDTISDGQAKWWMSGTGQTLRTWDYFVEQFPEAVVIAYGFNQGTYNAETYSVVQDIEFDCAVTSFAAPGRGSDPVTPIDDGNALGDNTGKVLATSTKTLPATLPATGDTFNPMSIIIASLAAYGAAYFAQGRRRVSEI